MILWNRHLPTTASSSNRSSSEASTILPSLLNVTCAPRYACRQCVLWFLGFDDATTRPRSSRITSPVTGSRSGNSTLKSLVSTKGERTCHAASVRTSKSVFRVARVFGWLCGSMNAIVMISVNAMCSVPSLHSLGRERIAVGLVAG